MFNSILNIIRKIIFSFLLIYAYNKLSSPINIFIPINFVTIALVSIFGIPSLIMFILFSFIII